MGKHSAPKPPLPSVGLVGPAIVTGAVGVPAVLLTGFSGQAAAATTTVPTTDTTSQTTVPADTPFLPPTDAELARLRLCEASGRYSTDTGNGFYGAYQFDAQTWRGLGLPGLPHEASPDTQDTAATLLEEQRGWQPWPACSQRLALIPRRNHGLTVQQVLGVQPQAPVTTVATAPTPVQSHAAPAFTAVLSEASATTYRSDVRLWQERMAQRGWPITVDGFFGQQSSGVAQAFSTAKGITEGLSGEVGPQGWSAAWTLPVS